MPGSTAMPTTALSGLIVPKELLIPPASRLLAIWVMPVQPT